MGPALLTCFPGLLDTLYTYTITLGSKLAFSYIAGTLLGLDKQLRIVLTEQWQYPLSGVVTHAG